MLSLYWNNHKATFCHILSTLREKERYTDVTLACQGKFYQVHKLVLSACSEYFESMFENTPCKHPVIVLKDIRPDDLEALLSYMYAGVVSVAQNDLSRLIKTAELLQIKGLAVPDEPPISPDNKKGRGTKDDRTSPPPKRKKREENGQINSPSSSPQRTEYQDTDYRPRPNRSRSYTDSQQTEPPPEEESSAPEIKQVVVDESLVKEEIQEVQEIHDVHDDSLDGKDDSQFYSQDLGESSLDRVQNEDGSSLHDSQGFSGQPQPLPDAVAEALAGPSGMQGWLSGDLGNHGFSENYGDGENSQLGQQQMVDYLCDGPPDGNAASTTTSQQAVSSGFFKPENFMASAGYQRCHLCIYTAKTREQLERHIESHKTERPFTCPYCTYSATQRGNLTVHLRRHTGEKPYSCTFCPYKTKHSNTLKSHMRTHLVNKT